MSAYKLFWDFSHLPGERYDATLISFEKSGSVCGFMDTRKFKLPTQVYFEANMKVIPTSDFPCNNKNWPLMSVRMREILTSLGDFPHQEHPVIMLDQKVPKSKRFAADGSIICAHDSSFVAVQLTEHLDCFDWEKSVYERCTIIPEEVGVIHRMVLKEPENGFPPLFRVLGCKRYLLVSSEAKRVLEAHGIRGATFKHIDDIRY